MEGSLLGRLFMGLFKFVFSSVVVGGISLVASTSFMTGKFPPDWSQVKNMLGTIQKVRDLQKNIKGAKGGIDPSKVNLNTLANVENLSPEQLKQLGALGSQTVGQNHNQAEAKTGNSKNKMYEDPEMADVREIMQNHENMRNLAANLNGEAVALNPANNGGTANVNTNSPPRPQQGGSVSGSSSTDSRMRALELQIENLTMRLRELTGTVSEMNDRLNSLQRNRR